MHPRNLQHALDKDGACFADLLDQARIAMARRHLGSSNQAVGTVAHLLGYATPSSFTRWFHGEFTMSPTAWRTQADVAATTQQER